MRVEHATVPDVTRFCLRSPPHWNMKNPAVVQGCPRERRGVEERGSVLKMTADAGLHSAGCLLVLDV